MDKCGFYMFHGLAKLLCQEEATVEFSRKESMNHWEGTAFRRVCDQHVQSYYVAQSDGWAQVKEIKA